MQTQNADHAAHIEPPKKRVLVVEDDGTLQPIIRRMMRKLNPNAIVDWQAVFNKLEN
jgi:hypothetical protein